MPAATLLDFWFSPESRERWFNATPEFDAQLRSVYEGLWQQGRDGMLPTSTNSSQSPENHRRAAYYHILDIQKRSVKVDIEI